jgi:UrcA family protein
MNDPNLGSTGVATMHISVPTFTAAIMLAALSFGAHADTSSQPVKITGTSAVYYGDLNLNAEQDAKTMLERIEQAARKACGGHPTFNSITGRLDSTFQDCRNEAVARTVEQLGAAMVTRIYSEARLRES